MRKRHAISYARIERRKLQGEGEAISKTLGFRDGQWVESQFRFSMWPHCARAECRDWGRRENKKEGTERRGRRSGSNTFRPVREWIPTGIAKAADEFANHGTASIERFYQAIQAVLIPFVPLLGNIRRKLPDLIPIHP